MSNVITDVVYIDGKKERFTSKTPPFVADGILTNSGYASRSITSKVGNEADDTVFGVQMSEVRRYSYKLQQ